MSQHSTPIPDAGAKLGENNMPKFQTLEDFLEKEQPEDETGQAVLQLCRQLRTALIKISTIVACGPLAGDLAAAQDTNADGDVQKKLDIVAHDYIIDALKNSPAAWILSEEQDLPIELDRSRPLAIAIDPLDGSSNIETNAPIGTIFSILPNPGPDATAEEVFLQPGTRQLAAGYCIYGPHTKLVLTIGNGTEMFTLDPLNKEFRHTRTETAIPETTTEFAVNASNARHWERAVRSYFDDCIAGDPGIPRGNYNMRWIASLVAECHRILIRGGVFLYPRDKREGYEQGRLRLLYEAIPIAMLVEQADGYATTGEQRILEVQPREFHQRIPLIFGSRREIRRIEDYFAGKNMTAARSELFREHGLFNT
jgi:fructose-1,6-bisphosphatase I